MNIETMMVKEFERLDMMLDAEVLQVVKGSIGLPQKEILKKLRKEFPELKEFELCASLQRLIDRTGK